jgi:hypothetical protein
MEITVIDDRVEDGEWWSLPRYAGYVASTLRVGEVYMRDVRSMVQNVLHKAGGAQISRLNVIDHGNPHGVQFGSDQVTVDTIGMHSATLGRLRGRFTKGGFVHLQHCEIAQNQSLMIAFSRVFGVDVYGGTGYHNPIYRVNLGEYVVCKHSGPCIGGVPRP